MGLTRADLLPIIERPKPARRDWSGKWFIYGAGYRGKLAASLLAAAGGEVLGFIDLRAGELGEVAGCPVWRPGDGEVTERTDAAILLAVFNPEAATTTIMEALGPAFRARIVPYYEFWTAFGEAAGEAYWMGSREVYLERLEEITKAFEVLEDEASRQVFVAALRARLQDEWLPLEQLRVPHQYFPPDVPRPGRVRMIDGGACHGDALEWAAGAGVDVEQVWAFEPDLVNFGRLSRALEAGELKTKAAALWPCGIWSGTAVLRFDAGRGGASCLSDGGDTVVPVVALDQVWPQRVDANFVKLDIEGAEAAALAGMERLLRAQRPQLAVCVYHKPEDLWAILLQLRAMDLDYRFYLRSHAYSGLDIVLYAVPV